MEADRTAVEQGLHAPPLGEHGEPCAGCGAPLAGDQRYCLSCGRRRAGTRVPFMEILGAGRLEPTESTAAPPPRRASTALLGLAGAGAFALVLGLGVLIGSLAGDDEPRQVAAARPQVISVAAPAAGAAAASTELTSDWPAGKDGFTVQLETLPKQGSEIAAVEAAKSDAEAKGAGDVGALDSDDYASLDGGQYVVYSGVFDTRRQARRALRKLRGDFSGARVIEVSAGDKGDADALSGKKKEATVGRDQLEELQKLSPEEYQKKARKLPDTTKLPGKAPPKDEKQPGGGGKGEVIE